VGKLKQPLIPDKRLASVEHPMSRIELPGKVDHLDIFLIWTSFDIFLIGKSGPSGHSQSHLPCSSKVSLLLIKGLDLSIPPSGSHGRAIGISNQKWRLMAGVQGVAVE
jgi:hypothetical protein